MIEYEIYTGARIYCARGASKWGLGFTKYQALDAARPNHNEEMSVVMLPAEAYQPTVDMMGTLYWKGGEGDAEKVGIFKAEVDDDGEGSFTEYTEIDSPSE